TPSASSSFAPSSAWSVPPITPFRLARAFLDPGPLVNLPGTRLAGNPCPTCPALRNTAMAGTRISAILLYVLVAAAAAAVSASQSPNAQNQKPNAVPFARPPAAPPSIRPATLPAPGGDKADDVKLAVDLVVLDALVLEQKTGKIAGNLSRDSFTLLEDGA